METKLAIGMVSMKVLEGLQIASVKYGSKYKPKLGSYGAYTITTVCGKTFVCWNSLGEVCIAEEIEK